MSEEYLGFEQGPIRPPSEAFSLLIRVTRNCPWNRCTFCPVYKGSQFSPRPVSHVIRDIDAIFHCICLIQEVLRQDGSSTLEEYHIDSIYQKLEPSLATAFQAAAHWFYYGMESIFIQDANSLVIKPTDFIAILTHLKKCFPQVKRITSYTRSHTVAGIKEEKLHQMADAGLNRLHIGMESACDKVLDNVQKGASKALHIQAGVKVKGAGIELSEYVIPGLGGNELSNDHALETADALNQINPDFIRLRTLAIPNGLKLFKQWESGTFTKCTEIETAQEILLFIQHLQGITSTIKSDHILNLFQELEGTLPKDKSYMENLLRSFLSMPPEEQALYQLGRRIGVFMTLGDLENTVLREKVETLYRKAKATPQNIDQLISELMKRFI